MSGAAWIKTSDSLPPFKPSIFTEEESEWVLVSTKYGYVDIVRLITIDNELKWEKEVGWDENGVRELDYVIGWQPLPEPMKEE